jgi:fucose permease
MKLTYKNTMTSCFVGYIVQAINANFVPLLFLTFQDSFGIPLDQITVLIVTNFVVQLTVDATAPLYVDKLGYRPCIVAAHVFSAAGILMLTFLPEVMPPFAGLLISVATYAIGGGLIEVLVSPITESCPTDNKEKAMSLLHSFYCWGSVGVVLLSTIFFTVFGIENWKIMGVIWALIPIVNAFLFAKVPMVPLIAEGERGMKMGELFRNKVFWILLLMMVCAGASELAIGQWASAFAEKGLGISKTAGDLAGPMAFAVLMGVVRVFYGKFGHKINLDKFIGLSAVVCVASYLMIALVPNPIINLIGCGLCGLGVSIMWPGTLSKASVLLKNGGTTMFALLAVAGDLGCTTGPMVVGLVSDAAGDNLKTGIFAAIAFPVLLVACALLTSGRKKAK